MLWCATFDSPTALSRGPLTPLSCPSPAPRRPPLRILENQPALLYLVPCTLGLFAFLAHSDGTLRNMWEGPASMNVEHLGYDGLLSEESTVGTKEGIGGLRGEHRYLGRVRGGSSSPLSTSGKRTLLLPLLTVSCCLSCLFCPALFPCFVSPVFLSCG